jgi:hypothetical protein
MSDLKELQEMTDEELEGMLEKKWDDWYYSVILAEIQRRSFSKKLDKSFTPKWVGWATLAIGFAGLILTVVALFK